MAARRIIGVKFDPDEGVVGTTTTVVMEYFSDRPHTVSMLPHVLSKTRFDVKAQEEGEPPHHEFVTMTQVGEHHVFFDLDGYQMEAILRVKES